MSSFLVLLCIFFILGLVLVILLWNASSRSKSNALPVRSGRDWKVWLLYAGVALVISLWTIAGALFFLGVVWILRLDPKPYSKETPFPLDVEKKTARILYAWLMLSSFLTVPVFIIALFSLSSDPSTNEQVLAALIPSIFHILLLFGLSSKSAFVFRHTQQAILLVSIRAGLTALIISINPDEFVWLALFLLGNGAVWLAGSLWGWAQVRNGECWFMRRKGERILDKTKTVSPPDLREESKLSPEKYIEYSKWYLKQERQESAREYALEAFRLGNPATRQQAVEVLSSLGEVEMF